MKKVLLLLMILIIPIFTFAAEYQIDDINLKLNIDDDVIVFTRDNLDNNEDLAGLSLTKEQMLQILKNGNIYLDLVEKNLSWEFLVIVPDNSLSVNNLANLPDKLVRETGESLKTKFNAKDFKIYTTDKLKFVAVNYYDEKTKYYITNYYTVVNGHGYNFQMQKREEITDDEESFIKRIVDSADIEIMKGYEKESDEVQKQIDGYNHPFNWKAIITDGIIGGVVGGVAALVALIVKKKKNN